MKNLIFLVLLLPSIALSAPHPWLKKADPNEMFLNLFAENCPFTQSVLDDIVEGVLIRSRIKRKSDFTIGEPTLFVSAACLVEGEYHIFQVTILLVKYSSTDDGIALMTHRFGGYGTFGRGKADMIVRSIRESVEEAITDYLKSNFDLEEQEK